MSDEQYRFPEINPHPILVCDLKCRILYSNPAAKRFFEKLKMTEPEFQKHLDRKNICKIFESKEVVEEEQTINDVTFAVMYRPFEDGIFLSITDITERKRDEEELTWAAKVNTSLAELSRALITSASIDDISSLVLEHAKRLTGSMFGYVGYIELQTGYLVAPTLTRDIWDSCQVADKDVVFKKFSGLWGWVLNNREPLLTNAPAEDPRSSGVPEGHIPIRRFLSAPALIGETLVGQVALANSGHDYSEKDLAVVERLAALYALAIQRKQAEEEIKKAKDELEDRVEERTRELEESRDAVLNVVEDLEEEKKKLEVAYDELKTLDTLKTDIISNVSHELRTPITVAKGAMELAFEEAEAESRNRLLKVAIDALRRQDHIVGDLVEAASMEMGKKELNLTNVDISQLITLKISEFKATAAKKDIKMDVRMEDHLPMVRADPDEIMHVLWNLIDNAIKFSERGGEVVIEAGENGSMVQVCVSDSGVGIPDEKLGKIFDRLYQGDPSTTRAYGGTGMGLAIVKRVVEAHGGEVTVKTKQGEGSRFCFTVPVAN